MSPFCPPAYVRLVPFVPLFSAMYYSLKIRGQTVPLINSTNSYSMCYRRDAIAKLSRHGVPRRRSAKIVRIFVGLCPCQSCALIKTCCRARDCHKKNFRPHLRPVIWPFQTLSTSIFVGQENSSGPFRPSQPLQYL